MTLWIWLSIIYVALATITFLLCAWVWIRGVKLFPGGASPEVSPSFSEDAKIRLQQNHSRIEGTLRFWKAQATRYTRFHNLELPSIGVMVGGMVVPPSGSVSSLLG
jgi:hypothetical protein